MKRLVPFLAAVLCLRASPAPCQDPTAPDEPGCKDSALLSRLQGCKISRCEYSDFDAAELQVGPTNESSGEWPKKALEGRLERIQFLCPGRYSNLQVGRNAENALKAAGYSLDHAGPRGDDRVVTAHKAGTYVEVVTERFNEFSGYALTTLRVKGMEQQMTASASDMAAAIGRSGRVAVYGIEFDSGKATLRLESEVVLSEIAKLALQNSSWRLQVEGHTDSVGQKSANQSLSEQRAAAVAAWLAAHGVDKGRLSSQGFGDGRPIADNRTEEGRAKNRRVELVKQ